MHILHISMSPFESTYGGLEVYLRQIVQWQVNHGNDVWVLSIYWHGDCWREISIRDEPNLHVLEFHLPVKLQNLDFSRSNVQLKQHLRQLIARIHPDICHGHHGFAYEAVEICREFGIPAIYTAHCGEPFCPTGMLLKPNGKICDGTFSWRKCLFCRTYTLPMGFLLRFLVRMLPERIIRWFELKIDLWPFILFLTPLFTETRYLRKLQREIKCLSLCDLVIAPSHASAELVKSSGLTAPVEVLPHALPKTIDTLPFPGFHDGIVHFYYSGRICAVKGIHILLKAFSLLTHSNWRLHIIGESSETEEKIYKNNMLKTFTDPRIIWHGKVAHEKLADLIKDYHIMIHPACWFEVYGLSVAEALAFGRPVIATACGGPEEQILHGKNGWIIPKNDVNALTNLIDTILNDPLKLKAFQPQPKVPFADYMERLMNTYKRICGKM